MGSVVHDVEEAYGLMTCFSLTHRQVLGYYSFEGQVSICNYAWSRMRPHYPLGGLLAALHPVTHRDASVVPGDPSIMIYPEGGKIQLAPLFVRDGSADGKSVKALFDGSHLFVGNASDPSGVPHAPSYVSEYRVQVNPARYE